jgi:hypothetical protein
MCDGGQTLLERLRVVTGNLAVEAGAGQGKDVNGGGRCLLQPGHMEASASAWLAL